MHTIFSRVSAKSWNSETLSLKNFICMLHEVPHCNKSFCLVAVPVSPTSFTAFSSFPFYYATKCFSIKIEQWEIFMEERGKTLFPYL